MHLCGNPFLPTWEKALNVMIHSKILSYITESVKTFHTNNWASRSSHGSHLALTCSTCSCGFGTYWVNDRKLQNLPGCLSLFRDTHKSSFWESWSSYHHRHVGGNGPPVNNKCGWDVFSCQAYTYCNTNREYVFPLKPLVQQIEGSVWY